MTHCGIPLPRCRSKPREMLHEMNVLIWSSSVGTGGLKIYHRRGELCCVGYLKLVQVESFVGVVPT